MSRSTPSFHPSYTEARARLDRKTTLISMNDTKKSWYTGCMKIAAGSWTSG
jgi:hypothetical protein